jgi:hypothetical protein
METVRHQTESVIVERDLVLYGAGAGGARLDGIGDAGGADACAR